MKSKPSINGHSLSILDVLKSITICLVCGHFTPSHCGGGGPLRAVCSVHCSLPCLCLTALPVSGTNQLIKSACDNTDAGLISDDVDTAYREEVEQLMNKCKGTNLSQIISWSHLRTSGWGTSVVAEWRRSAACWQDSRMPCLLEKTDNLIAGGHAVLILFQLACNSLSQTE